MDETTQRIFCTDCNIPFNSKRALVKHRRTAKVHVQKQFPCPECGNLYTDRGSVARHVKNKVCVKMSPSSASPSMCAVKHMIEDDVEDRSPKRYRGEGPVEADHASVEEGFAEETAPRSTAVDISVTTTSTSESSQCPEDTSDPMYHDPLLADISSHSLGEMSTEMDQSSKTASSTASFIDRSDSPWGSSYASVSTQPTSDGESITQFSETTNVESSNTLTTPRDATLAPSTVTERQDTALSDAMKHVSIDVDTIPISCETAELEPAISVNERSRFSITENILSGHSRHSVASLGSIGSLFLNRSIRSSMSSSALSFKSVGWRSFHSFDMPAPMLEDIDEELGRSRTQDHFWKRHDPRRLRQKMLLQGFWKYIRNNDVAGVTRSLASGEVDVNLKNDRGWTPLRFAASKGHIEIVVLLLAHDSIDLDFHDEYGTTALSWAATVGQLEIVKQLLGSGKVDKYLKGGVGSASFAFASQNSHPEVADLILAKLDKYEPITCSTSITVTDSYAGCSVSMDGETLATSRYTTLSSDNVRCSPTGGTSTSKSEVLTTEYQLSRPGEQISFRGNGGAGGWI
jgi:hypothetical protein